MNYSTEDIKPTIMIGIPTYKRSHLLINVLRSLNSQTYNNFIVLVSVNGENNDIVDYKKLEKSLDYNLNIKFHFQNKKLDTLNNFFYLLDKCESKYFTKMVYYHISFTKTHIKRSANVDKLKV